MNRKKAVILFIDDEKNILSSYRRLFMDEPYELYFAESALEGLRVLRDRTPEVIVCDLKMPEMDGIEFFSHARNTSPDSLRIMISAISDKEQVVRAIKNELVWKYILKPWEDTQLLAVISEAVELSRKSIDQNYTSHSVNCGKKIFFLYPPDIFREEIMVDLIYFGYECYEIHDHLKAPLVLEKHKDSLFFVNIDKNIRDLNWKEYILSIMHTESTRSILTGVVSYNTDQKLREQYFFHIGIQCGFIQLKAGVPKIRETMLKVFEANEAKGRRQAVRILIDKQEDAVFNIKYAAGLYSGRIIDISSDAMACILNDHPRLQIDDQIDNIQLKLKGVPVQTMGTVKIKKMQNGVYLFIILFNHPKEEIRKKICRFIHKSLIEKLDRELTELESRKKYIKHDEGPENQEGGKNEE